MRCLLLLLLVLSASRAGTQTYAPDRAQAVAASHTGCPWLTAGSAAKILSGDVDVTVTGSNAEEGTCRFSRRDAAMDSLEIVVGKNASPTCPPESLKLVGIGNEAARCKVSGEMAKMLSGRVRDLHFTLILRGGSNEVKSSDPQDDALEQLAEQVAGNLF